MKTWFARMLAAAAGLPPEKAALLLAVGLVIGVFPVMGCPTALCLLTGMALRINPAPLLALNHAASPLQLLLIFPLARAGSWICHSPTATRPGMLFGAAAMHALTGWACCCVPLGVALYCVLLMALRRGASRSERPANAFCAPLDSRIPANISGIS